MKFRPKVESLESREVPATDTWTAQLAGNWNVAANWSNGVPLPGDTVVIGSRSGQVNITEGSGSSLNIASIQVADSIPGNDGWTPNITNAIPVNIGNSFSSNGINWTASAPVSFNNSVSMFGKTYFAVGPQPQNVGIYYSANNEINGFNVYGSLNDDSVPITIQSGTLFLSNSGSISFGVNNASYFVNYGAVSASSADNNNTPSITGASSIDNYGQIRDNAANFTLSAATSIQNSGTMTIYAGQKITFNNTGTNDADLTSCGGTFNLRDNATINCANVNKGISSTGDTFNFGAGETINGTMLANSDNFMFPAKSSLTGNSDWYINNSNFMMTLFCDAANNNAITVSTFSTTGKAIAVGSSMNFVVQGGGTLPNRYSVDFWTANGGTSDFQTWNLMSPLNEHGLDGNNSLYVGVVPPMSPPNP